MIRCEEVWREISNYLEGEIDPNLRKAIEEHLQGCKHCTAVLDGTRNVIQLYGDERMTELPPGFSDRLRQSLSTNVNGRRSLLGWIVTAAAAAVLEECEKAGVTIGPIYNMEDIAKDPNIKARGSIISVFDPSSETDIPFPEAPIRLSGTLRRSTTTMYPMYTARQIHQSG